MKKIEIVSLSDLEPSIIYHGIDSNSKNPNRVYPFRRKKEYDSQIKETKTKRYFIFNRYVREEVDRVYKYNTYIVMPDGENIPSKDWEPTHIIE